MKRTRLLPLMLVGALSIASVPAYADTQDEINEAYAAELAATDDLNTAQARISGLELQKQDMENYLSNLNSQYESLTKNVEELSLEAAEKSEELKKLKIELQRAKVKRLEQYEKVKLRVSYMYEKGETSWFTALLESKDLAEFVNRAENMMKMAEYDRKMLAEYEEAQNKILEEEKAMEKEVEEINKLLSQSNEKRQKIRDLAVSTEDSIYSYAQEITSTQEEAAYLVSQIEASREQQYSLLVSMSQVPAQTAEYSETSYDAADTAVYDTTVYEAPAEDLYGQQDYSYAAVDTQDYETAVPAEEYQVPETAAADNSGYYAEEPAAAEVSYEIPDTTYTEDAQVSAGLPEGAVYDSATGLYTMTVIYGGSAGQQDADTTYADTTYEEPTYGGAVYAETVYADTTYDEQTYGEPVYEEPTYDDVTYEEPTYDEVTYEEPTYEDTSSGSGQGTYLGTFTLTAYCGCASCCGVAGQPTASGVMPVQGRTVAMGGVPFGTQLLINGYVYTVEDLGTPYGHVDIYFDSHEAALAFGRQSAEVYQLS